MYLENMYFAEIPIMALGILLFIKSSEKLVESKYLKSLAYLIIGELCYQGTINFFITFTFLLLIIKNKGINKDTIETNRPKRIIQRIPTENAADQRFRL